MRKAFRDKSFMLDMLTLLPIVLIVGAIVWFTAFPLLRTRYLLIPRDAAEAFHSYIATEYCGGAPCDHIEVEWLRPMPPDGWCIRVDMYPDQALESRVHDNITMERNGPGWRFGSTSASVCD
jgi:hypothetical protein